MSRPRPSHRKSEAGALVSSEVPHEGESVHNACESGTECCLECPYLNVAVRRAAAEHLRAGISDWVDRPFTGCARYCGRFDEDKRCLGCEIRVSIAQRVKEMREGVQLKLSWEPASDGRATAP